MAVERTHLTSDNQLSTGATFILTEFETLLAKTKKTVASEILGADSVQFIETYRLMFPAKRVPKVGLLRQTPQELKDKFVWFFKTYPQFSWEDVLNGTDYYIYTKQKENMEFVTTSSYFIQRTDNFTKTSRSLLADYCQMFKDNPEITGED